MFSKRIKATVSSTAFRLAAWYSSIFITSSVVLFFLAFQMISGIVEDQDREQTRFKLREYVLTAREEGIGDMIEEITREKNDYRPAGFFVRVTDSNNRTLICSLPRRFKAIDCSEIPLFTSDNSLESIVIPRHEDEDVLEIVSTRLPGNYILQVGKSSTQREDLLEKFYQIFLTILLLLAVLGLLAGSFMAFKALSPLRELANTVRKIRAGNMEARVPVRDAHGSRRDELDTLAILFNKMLQRIDTLVKGMREALDSVAHDLRTPVTRLRAVVESTLQKQAGREELENALMDCAEEADRISDILSTLMDISEAETGVMRLELKKQFLQPLIMDVVELYEYVAEEKAISITVDIPEELEIPLDRNRFRQAAANLVDNAIKYGKEGGRLVIRARRENSCVTLSFTDDGAGIDPMDIPRIFDRLYRGDKGRSQKGLGLGLSLVKAVVEGHNFTIEAESAPGIGTKISIKMPIA